MKRNKQQKFRMKIIQELHLNKSKQKRLDDCINGSIFDYKIIYKYKNYPYMLETIYLCKRYTSVLNNTSSYYQLISYSFNNLGKVLNKICDDLNKIE